MRSVSVGELVTKKSALSAVFTHSSMSPRSCRGRFRRRPITSASDSISAITVADVRFGAAIRLSAASAPSTGRIQQSNGRSAREPGPEQNGVSSRAATRIEHEADVEQRQRARRDTITIARPQRRSPPTITVRRPVQPRAALGRVPFCSALTGSTRAAARAGTIAASALVARPTPIASATTRRRRARSRPVPADAVDAAAPAGRRPAPSRRRRLAEHRRRPPTRPAPNQRSRGGTAPAIWPRDGAERAQQADLAAPLRHRNRERVVDDEHADDERERAREDQHEAVDRAAAPRNSGRGVAGGCTSKPGPAATAAPACTSATREPLRHREIDAVELAAAAEHELRGVDVHDREVAAERAAQAAGRRMPRTMNRLRPVHGIERHARC